MHPSSIKFRFFLLFALRYCVDFDRECHLHLSIIFYLQSLRSALPLSLSFLHLDFFAGVMCTHTHHILIVCVPFNRRIYSVLCDVCIFLQFEWHQKQQQKKRNFFGAEWNARSADIRWGFSTLSLSYSVPFLYLPNNNKSNKLMCMSCTCRVLLFHSWFPFYHSTTVLFLDVYSLKWNKTTASQRDMKIKQKLSLCTRAHSHILMRWVTECADGMQPL